VTADARKGTRYRRVHHQKKDHKDVRETGRGAHPTYHECEQSFSQYFDFPVLAYCPILRRGSGDMWFAIGFDLLAI
jgi:hypothetical protein